MLTKTTVSDKTFKDSVYENALNPKNDENQRELVSMVDIFFDKKIKSGVNVNEVTPQELHKAVIKTLERKKIYDMFKDIWGADLAEEGSTPLFNCSVKYLLNVINLFTGHEWVKFFELKTVLNSFMEIVNESKHKPSNLWVAQGAEFYNNLK